MAKKPSKKENKPKSSFFVCEIPLKVFPQEESVLLTRLEAGRQLYNACLGEAMRRLNLIRQSRDYQKARSLNKADSQRLVLFKKARTDFEFSDYAIQAYATRIRHSWIGEHIDSHTAQKLATRAYNAAEKVLFKKAKKVRFKGRNQMDSLEGKSNAAGIRWGTDAMEWSGLKLSAIINDYDPLIIHGLASRVKYCRLVRRKRNGRNLFYAQLVCVGIPFQKPNNRIGSGDVGLDIGPSTIAVVSEESASLRQFAAEVELLDLQLRKLQRKLARSRRANNPENYNSNGTFKKGRLNWNNSNNYIKTRDSKANLERKLAGQRKSLHGKMVNEILREGNVIKLEKLSYKAFQKLFGKSVGRRAPGMFVSHLKRKAENANAKVVEFPTYSTKLSQTCHCGRVKKKKLERRVHQCECGVLAQRDLYSAFLAKYIDPDNHVLQVNQASDAWYSEESRLRAAWRTATQNETASRGLLPSSFGRCPESEQFVAEVQTQTPKSQDVVAVKREPGKGCPPRKDRGVGTPQL